jgi:hypothetical protein
MKEKRVIVLRSMVGICHMQVCAVQDATDAEILGTCNQENTSGTENGWDRVLRSPEPDSIFFKYPEEAVPIVCENDSNRKHFMVAC